MAWTFDTKQSAVIHAQLANSTSMYSVYGCTTASTTPENAATQINKLLDVGGKAIVVNSKMYRSSTEEAVDNG